LPKVCKVVKLRSIKDMKTELKQSENLYKIINLLNENPTKFTMIQKKLSMSSRTVDKHLDFAKAAGLATHKRWSSPYEITPKGKKWLKIHQPKQVENFQIEYVKSGAFTGSIIFNVPRNFVGSFNTLYAPGPLEGLRRIFEVAFGFWVNRYGCRQPLSYGVKVGECLAYGKDYNNDKIWDLVIYTFWKCRASLCPRS
jgi:predicted transcriptional regulator